MRKLDLGEKLIIEIKKYSETEQINTRRNINRINAAIDKKVEAIYRQKNSGKSGSTLVLTHSEILKDIYNNRLAIKNYEKKLKNKKQINIGLQLEYASRLVEDSKMRAMDSFTLKAYDEAFRVNNEAEEIAKGIVNKAKKIASSNETITLEFENAYEYELIINKVMDEINEIESESLKNKLLSSVIAIKNNFN